MPSNETIIAKLRDYAVGKFVWRVQDDSKAYCIQFEDYEKDEAKRWWNESILRHAEEYKAYELARVHVFSSTERLMLMAADQLESLLKSQKECK